MPELDFSTLLKDATQTGCPVDESPWGGQGMSEAFAKAKKKTRRPRQSEAVGPYVFDATYQRWLAETGGDPPQAADEPRVRVRRPKWDGCFGDELLDAIISGERYRGLHPDDFDKFALGNPKLASKSILCKALVFGRFGRRYRYDTPLAIPPNVSADAMPDGLTPAQIRQALAKPQSSADKVQAAWGASLTGASAKAEYQRTEKAEHRYRRRFKPFSVMTGSSETPYEWTLGSTIQQQPAAAGGSTDEVVRLREIIATMQLSERDRLIFQRRLIDDADLAVVTDELRAAGLAPWSRSRIYATAVDLKQQFIAAAKIFSESLNGSQQRT